MRRELLLSGLLGLGALAGCALDEIDTPLAGAADAGALDTASSGLELIACRICAGPPAVRRWSTRNPAVRMWPTTARRAATVITRGSTAGSWRAYGVDATGGRLAFVFEGTLAELADFARVDAGEWAATSAFDAGVDHSTSGSFKKPLPNPPGPVGTPPPPLTLRAVERAADQALATLDDMFAAM